LIKARVQQRIEISIEHRLEPRLNPSLIPWVAPRLEPEHYSMSYWLSCCCPRHIGIRQEGGIDSSEPWNQNNAINYDESAESFCHQGPML